MTTVLTTRRDFSVRMVSALSAFGIAGATLGHATVPSTNRPATVLGGSNEVTHTCEAIHQEVTFNAVRKRVYEALADAKQFHKVVLLSAAGMSLGNVPTEISREIGGTFSLFGGHILGRHIELVPNERMVQAWRVANWNPGTYSIAKFDLIEHGPATKLVFDHTGFPEGQGQHLADGWKSNYWEPLQKYLA